MTSSALWLSCSRHGHVYYQLVGFCFSLQILLFFHVLGFVLLLWLFEVLSELIIEKREMSETTILVSFDH